jgi:hypothetical protein
MHFSVGVGDSDMARIGAQSPFGMIGSLLAVLLLSSPTSGLARGAAIGVGAFQVLANGALLVRGLKRIPAELAREGASTRIANLLRTSWIYGVLANLCVSGILLLVAPALGRRDALAQLLGLAIAAYYLVLGIAAFSFAPGRQRGLLVFSLLGAVLGVTVLLSKARL